MSGIALSLARQVVKFPNSKSDTISQVTSTLKQRRNQNQTLKRNHKTTERIKTRLFHSVKLVPLPLGAALLLNPRTPLTPVTPIPLPLLIPEVEVDAAVLDDDNPRVDPRTIGLPRIGAPRREGVAASDEREKLTDQQGTSYKRRTARRTLLRQGLCFYLCLLPRLLFQLSFLSSSLRFDHFLRFQGFEGCLSFDILCFKEKLVNSFILKRSSVRARQTES